VTFVNGARITETAHRRRLVFITVSKFSSLPPVGTGVDLAGILGEDARQALKVSRCRVW